jgi:hypothetical protein
MYKNKYKNISTIIKKYKIDVIRNSIAHQLNKQISPSMAINNLENAIKSMEKIITK